MRTRILSCCCFAVVAWAKMFTQSENRVYKAERTFGPSIRGSRSCGAQFLTAHKHLRCTAHSTERRAKEIEQKVCSAFFTLKKHFSHFSHATTAAGKNTDPL